MGSSDPENRRRSTMNPYRYEITMKKYGKLQTDLLRKLSVLRENEVSNQPEIEDLKLRLKVVTARMKDVYYGRRDNGKSSEDI